MRIDVRESHTWSATDEDVFQRIDRITLDGEKVEAVAADEEAGVVVAYLTDNDPEWDEARHRKILRRGADIYVARRGAVKIHLNASR
jgi:hypothetical protein